MVYNFWEISYISTSGEHLEKCVKANKNRTKHLVWDLFSNRNDVLLVKLVTEAEVEPKEFITL